MVIKNEWKYAVVSMLDRENVRLGTCRVGYYRRSSATNKMQPGKVEGRRIDRPKRSVDIIDAKKRLDWIVRTKVGIIFPVLSNVFCNMSYLL